MLFNKNSLFFEVFGGKSRGYFNPFLFKQISLKQKKFQGKIKRGIKQHVAQKQYFCEKQILYHLAISEIISYLIAL